MKRFSLLFSMVFFSHCILAQSILDSVLVYYKMDGNVVDFSGNGMDGTHVGPVGVEDEFNNPNSAFYFDGVDDFIDFPNDPSLKPQLPFTYSLKVRFESLEQVEAYMFTSDFEENNYHGTWANLTPDASGRVAVSFAAGLGNTSSANRRTKASEASVVTQKWYLLTFVVRGATDIDIYIDCVDAGGSYSGNGSTQVAYSNVPGSIGRRDAHTGNPPYYFNGSIDYFIAWNRALSQSEVISLCDGILGSGEEESLRLERSVRVYPNPSVGQSVLEFANPEEHDCSVNIFDSQGKLVYAKRLTTDRLVIAESMRLNSGLYTCQVFDETNAETLGTVRLVVE